MYEGKKEVHAVKVRINTWVSSRRADGGVEINSGVSRMMAGLEHVVSTQLNHLEAHIFRSYRLMSNVR